MTDCPQDIVADFADGNLTERYVRGIGLILSKDSTSGQCYYLYNTHGDVVQLTNNAGAVEWLYDYDAFGNQRDIQGQNLERDSNLPLLRGVFRFIDENKKAVDNAVNIEDV